jgi:hypothetical protein
MNRLQAALQTAKQVGAAGLVDEVAGTVGAVDAGS